MKLVTFRYRDQAARVAALVDGLVVDLAALGAQAGSPLPSTMLEFIEASPAALDVARVLVSRHQQHGWPVGTTWPVENVQLLAPIPRPRKNVFGIGLNYVEHVEESARSLDTAKDLPKQPVVFSKPPTCIIGPGAAIEHNREMTQQLDWEVELAVIIGKAAKRISEDDAMDHVFGYSVMIDVSARDCRRAGQWIFSKGQDTFGPFGPCIVTADEIPDPHALRLWLTVNGEIKQDSNTRYMLFRIPQLIADIASGMTLEPGDIIATGTPSGVGAGRTPQEWLWPGDVVECEVEAIGRLRHPVVAV